MPLSCQQYMDVIKKKIPKLLLGCIIRSIVHISREVAATLCFELVRALWQTHSGSVHYLRDGKVWGKSENSLKEVVFSLGLRGSLRGSGYKSQYISVRENTFLKTE